MTALQSIIKEAKAIRKKSPKMEWKKAVAQASAIYASKHKGKSPVGKKHVVKKKLGALPIGFSGNIWGIRFKVVNQYDIYGNVAAIVENVETGHRIITFDGHGSAKNLADIFGDYVARHGVEADPTNIKALKSRLLKFATQMQKEVKDFNSGKKKTIKKQPLTIIAPKHKVKSVKKVSTKKVKKTAKKHTHWGTVHSHERRVNGVGVIKKKAIRKTATKRKPTEKAVLKSIKHAVSVQKQHMGNIGGHAIDRIKSAMSHLSHYEHTYKKYMEMPLYEKKLFAGQIKKLKHIIKETKTHITQLKKSI
jgi:hypothetical protein